MRCGKKRDRTGKRGKRGGKRGRRRKVIHNFKASYPQGFSGEKNRVAGVRICDNPCPGGDAAGGSNRGGGRGGGERDGGGPGQPGRPRLSRGRRPGRRPGSVPRPPRPGTAIQSAIRGGPQCPLLITSAHYCPAPLTWRAVCRAGSCSRRRRSRGEGRRSRPGRSRQRRRRRRWRQLGRRPASLWPGGKNQR